MFKFTPIDYQQLNARQKENFNFQKIAAKLADYGFNCLWLNDDWQGADFIACHIDGHHFLKIQLKGRLTLDKKYNGKDIYIAFKCEDSWYLYPHDQLQSELLNIGLMQGSRSWEQTGCYSWASLPKVIQQQIKQYEL